MKDETGFAKLNTKFGAVDKNCPLPEYPRPQLKRDSYISLNGEWDFSIVTSYGIIRSSGKILVPFSPECSASGVNESLRPTETLKYRKAFALRGDSIESRVLLNFGAVDCCCTVLLNGEKICTHNGGYLPFSVEITRFLKDENVLELTVTDASDASDLYAVGKQKLKRGGIFYTPQSGIWQSVWLESVPENYVKSLVITPSFAKSEVFIKAETALPVERGSVKIFFNGELLSENELNPDGITVKLNGVMPWSPDAPSLYDVELRADEDIVTSYFGVRDIEVRDIKGEKIVCLNGEPLFLNGLLDQGYFPDGLYTAPTEEALLFDLTETKRLGFNTLRKHIKIEPLRWYYHCDRLGIIVIQDMVNGGKPALLNSVPAFLGIGINDTKGGLLSGRSSEQGKENYYSDLADEVKLLYNSPAVCVWTPFNEGWGQFCALEAEKRVRESDGTRLIDHASGWHDQGGGDFLSLHIYFKKLSLPKKSKYKIKRAKYISEFGGYGHNEAGHVFNLNKAFGYIIYSNKDTLNEKYRSLYYDQVLPLIKDGLTAIIYTQLTDVEDEINGLFTYDREVLKISEDIIRGANAALQEEFNKHFGRK
ncbi:MAG: glycoside hydrolase family 2 [Christensenellaceae bacterium]|jgi:beta-galactosidase/beta-glucuronidase|nr:glycoside hydrolase family 2 [Christensenellaceae bacterium]